MLDNAPSAVETSQSGEDRRLLIVDDDEPFRKRLARAMEKRGFEVNTVATVAEGVELARRDQPPFAVFDLRLTDGSGLDLTSSSRITRNLPKAFWICRRSLTFTS